MWRHIPGVAPPSKVRKTGDNRQQANVDQLTLASNTETTGPATPTTVSVTSVGSARKFSQRWYTTDSGQPREWLKFEGGVMFCIPCRAKATDKRKSNSFVIGSSVMKLEAIKSHETSKCHRDCSIVYKAQSTPLLAAPSVRQLTKLSDSTVAKMRILFRNAHAIAKKSRPYKDFAWMCE